MNTQERQVSRLPYSRKGHFFQGLIGGGALEHHHWTLEGWGRVD